MTRKDYRLIAETIREIVQNEDSNYSAKQIDEIIQTFGRNLAKDNPRFNWTIWLDVFENY